MSVTVRLYAAVRETAGKASVEVEGGTVAEVKEALARSLPALADRLRFCRFAVDDAFVPEDAEVREGAVVDVIPPVSGG